MSQTPDGPNKTFLQEQVYQHEFSKLYFNGLVYNESKNYNKSDRELLINCLFTFIFKDILEKHINKENTIEAKGCLDMERKDFLKYCDLEYGASLPKA